MQNISSPRSGTRYGTAGSTIGATTLRIAANDAPQWVKDAADYVCDGQNDEVEIQTAINSLPAALANSRYNGGEILLSV